MGPGRNSNSWFFMFSTEVPVMSEGIRSGVNCTRENRNPSKLASIRISVVFPTPGTSSMRTWESVRMPTRTRRSASRTPNSRPSIRSESPEKKALAASSSAMATG